MFMCIIEKINNFYRNNTNLKNGNFDAYTYICNITIYIICYRCVFRCIYTCNE